MIARGFWDSQVRLGNARSSGGNSVAGCGVYTGMFEQSILAGHGANRPWSFLASLSAELMIVSLAIMIPLVYSDHLPDFHWKSVMVGPPPRPIEPQPVTTNRSSATASPVVMHRVFIPSPDRPLLDNAVV